ncbi:hypothetical protein JQF37_25460 [Pseudomonas sp. MIL9]|uniref:hypothetical protein n=1 Tax=Pseudomonas sp. MIL9 TaxID=2807620 RepID=UPI00194F9E18|nr:hypothetical protein [Pseudomonas sp. MIL9]MBM6446950.1 hypothetical protein [Pseudomonas sp. MIL9]
MQAPLNLLKKANKYKHIFATFLITASFYWVLALANTYGPLLGQFDQYLQPGGMWAAPNNIKLHGYEAHLNPRKDNPGWDGEFYYFISDDPLILKDTTSHLDMPAYRYQRIGLGITAKIVSTLTLSNWVSPTHYFVASVLVLLLATISAAFFLFKHGHKPYWVLLWSMGGAPLFTIVYGFTDGAADGFLIIAVTALSSKRYCTYVISMSLAVLSREVYVLLPILILISTSLVQFKNPPTDDYISLINKILKKISPHMLVILCMCAWHFYIHYRLGTWPSAYAPSSQFAFPFESAMKYASQSAMGRTVAHYGDLTSTTPKFYQAIGITLFSLMLIIVIYSTARQIHRSYNQLLTDNGEYIGTLIGFTAIALLYSALGDVMFWEPVGYIKAGTVLCFFTLFAHTSQKRDIPFYFLLIAILNTGFSSHSIWKRIQAPITSLSSQSNANFSSEQPGCLVNPSATLEIVSNSKISPPFPVLSSIIPKRNLITLHITNTSKNETFSPFRGAGSVNASYIWMSSDGTQAIQEGIRSFLPTSLDPGESTEVPVLVEYPNHNGRYILRMTLIQEGCAWLSKLNPSISLDIPYNLE